MDDEMRKCASCGEYYPAGEAVQDKYCSWTCAVNYLQCRNCGRYYIRENGFSDELCSAACGEIFERETRY
jgi:predicted nucleic acid-binding Zn ribbon protein